MKSLSTDDVTDDVRKIANIVLQHLETLIPLTTAQGQRIKKLVRLSQNSWKSIAPNFESEQMKSTGQTRPFSRLKALSVGPFRGFIKQEKFDLDSHLILLYGPNGTGKSCFCEALEYCLLGSVTDAESKRFRNQREYLKNAYTNKFSSPFLSGIDTGGNDITVTSNEVLYRFCFIEKNRIDSFSRIAAQTPVKQTELISSLFGLDAFTEFVRNFTDSMDDRYIDLEGVKANELNKKRQAIEGSQQQLDEIIPNEMQTLNNEEIKLADKYRIGCTFDKMIFELHGSERERGLIDQLNDELQTPIRAKSNLTLIDLKKLKHSIESNLLLLNAKIGVFECASEQLLYKNLYEAVVQIMRSNPEKCPACHTPLSKATTNPYEYAEQELDKLQHLSKLQNEIERLNTKIGESIACLSQIIKACCCPDNELGLQLMNYQRPEGKTNDIEWWISLNQQLNDDTTPWQHIERQVEFLEAIDKEITQAIENRNDKKNELKRLRDFSEEIIRLQTRRDTIIESNKQHTQAIKDFMAVNAQLITDVRAEEVVIDRNKAIAKAYYIFVQKLNSYIVDLPGLLVADLGELIVQLYNAFNRHDAEHEQLSAVRLPLKSNQLLEIAFVCKPDTFYNALHILSEGHIRCMGLSILAAKNIKENCPLLIFDDPVNAIDDDHRESIRRAIFEDDYFINKQIILACHGEEFFKDIQNLLPKDKAKKAKRISFLPRSAEPNIRVDHNCSSRNYIIASRTHYEKNEIRDALDKARKALESLTKDKVWKYVNRHGDGSLSIKLSSPNAPIELRNLTEQLRKKIAKADFSDQNKAAILTPIIALLGVSGDAREWRYLNKGTHEEADRAEFDRQTVNDILTALEQLDSAFG